MAQPSHRLLRSEHASRSGAETIGP